MDIRSDMDYCDLDVDGEGISQVHTRPFTKHIGTYNKESTDVKCDSGFSEFSSFGSFKSGNRSVDSVDGAPATVWPLKKVVEEPTPSEDLNNRFKDLKVQNTESINDGGYYDSIQEGQELSVPQEQDNWCRQIEPETVDLFQQDTDGDSQLHMAIINLMSPIALYIISRAPHPEWLNLPNNLLQTPLHLAVLMRMPEVVRKLMVAGADVDPRDNKGDTPLHIACREGFDEIVEILMDPVRLAETQDNQYKIPYQKIPQDLEARNYNGQTCLHVAAEGTHLPCIRLLVNKGANVNATDGKSGRTVLHYAAESGNRILLEFLLQNPKVSVHARTYAGLTAIMLAYGRGFGDIILRLRQSGAKLEQPMTEESDSDEEMS